MEKKKTTNISVSTREIRARTFLLVSTFYLYITRLQA